MICLNVMLVLIKKQSKKAYSILISRQNIESYFGYPARENIALPLKDWGLGESLIQKNMRARLSFTSTYLKQEVKTASENSNVVLPGVLGLLEKIKSLDIPIGIVTGNLKENGEEIIECSNLSEFFDSRINTYSDGMPNRFKIVSTAIKRAKDRGIIGKCAKIYVFGDSPSDIKATRENGCISIAVIRNSNDLDSSLGGDVYNSRKEILEKAKPDFLLEDYTDLGKIIAILKR